MADPVSVTFNFTGGWQSLVVPAGCRVMNVTLKGAGSQGRQGGRVKGKLRVNGGDVIRISVGEQGRGGDTQAGGAGTFGGGGPGGNGGKPSRLGGMSGGGATELRLNTQDGTILAVAGGAGGQSGDGASNGGDGGGDRGEDGKRVGGGSSNVATGGTQSHGGNAGTVGSNPDYNGTAANDNLSNRGGEGGHSSEDKCVGGGGGGGGYHAGGGGQAGKVGVFPGGGGGGGSSFVGGLHDVELNDRNGGIGHGSVTFQYDPDGDPNPATPTDVTINGGEAGDDMAIRATGITVGAKLSDTTTANANGDLHLYMTLAPNYDPGAPGQLITDIGRMELRGSPINDTVWIPAGGSAPVSGYSSLQVNGLQANTLYRGRLYAQDARGQFSDGYTSISFWTDRPPNAPVIVSPAADTEFESGDTIAFQWTSSDPDAESGHPETPSAHSLRYRFAGTVKNPQPGPWVDVAVAGGVGSSHYSIPAANLTPGRWYEWSVADADPLGYWGPQSEISNFYVQAIALPPTLVQPSNGEAIYASENNVFEWRFNTLLSDETQITGDIRYRAVGASDADWVIITGDLDAPGSGPRWLIDAETFNEGVHYEWQARTHTSSSTVSAWSASEHFWATALPVAVPDLIPIDVTRIQEAIGQRKNRAYIYLRGGQVPVAELAPLYDIAWGRKRDDFESCTVHMTQWDEETKEMLRALRPWAFEIVVFRGGVRCWEGPITRISDNSERLEIEARDVSAYVYRRIMRNGYNDAYQIVAGQQVGLHTVVYRAQRIITNALIYDDPNVLPYLTPLHNPGDAIQSRVVKAYSKTAFNELDDLAAHAGLDYSIAGRRIILNDTHRPIGKLPELGDGDFSVPPEVTVYGMTYATDFAVTNNNGYWGLAARGRDAAGLLTGDAAQTGYIEQLASEYGESSPEGGAGTETLTPEEIAALQATLSAQAERNIAARYPMPVVVRVQDNATLDPNVNLGINQLIPGVWAPIRATGGLIQASQWQKLDAMSVREDESGEKISVVFSPAPNGGTDPDADIEEE